MATTTRHLRLDAEGGGGEDWKQTRIAMRVTPPKEPRDEKMMMFAKPRNGERKISPPMPLNTGSAQAKRKTIRLVSSSSVEAQRPTSPTIDHEAVLEPEIVDLAAPAPSRPRTNRPPPRRAPPPPPPPKRTHSWRKYGVPSTASRQSEISFGILDYYIHDTEPVSRSPDLTSSNGSATLRAVDPAIERFDFGLDERNRVRTPPPRDGGDAKSGAEEEEEEEMQLVPLSPRPFEEEREKPVVVNECHVKPSGVQHKKTYSLFPAVKETTPSTHNRLVQVYDKPIAYTTPGTRTKAPNTCLSQPKLFPGAEISNTNNKSPATTRQPAGTIDTFSPSTLSETYTTTTLPSPSYHRRNPSATLNPRTHTRLIPLRILSSSSTSTTNTTATHLTATTSRSSTSTSSPSSTSTHKPLLSSRWSEDTALASPTTAATVLGGTRASWGSLLGGAVGEGGYPDCFFEDDEEEGEGRPLRRGKVRGKGRGWRGWVCCGMV